MSYLYVIQCNEFYKVGIASDVAARVASLQTGNPYPLQVVAYYEFDNATPVEQSLHQCFAEQWQSGEWYKLGNGDLDKINSVCTLLGGKLETAPVEVGEQNVDDEQPVTPESVDQMERDGWRIEVINGGKYYHWRRGSADNRESRYGGYFADLPGDRQEEYFRRVEQRKEGKVEP